MITTTIIIIRKQETKMGYLYHSPAAMRRLVIFLKTDMVWMLMSVMAMLYVNSIPAKRADTGIHNMM